MTHRDAVKVAKAPNKAVQLFGQLDADVPVERVIIAIYKNWKGPEFGKERLITFLRALEEDI